MKKGSVSPRTRERDGRLYEWLCRVVAENDRFPTVRQVAEAMNLPSTSQADAALRRLEEAGLLVKDGRYRRLAKAGAVKATDPVGTAVPVLGTIAAGTPLLAEENIEGWVQVDPTLARNRTLFALQVRGDSMIEAGIMEKDLLILEQTPVVENGQIAACWIPEEGATVKRFYKEKGGYRLQPENSRLAPILTRECRVLGRVVALVRNYE